MPLFLKMRSGSLRCVLVLPSPGGVGGDLRGLHPAGPGHGLGRGSGHRAAHRGLQDSVVRAHGLVPTAARPQWCLAQWTESEGSKAFVTNHVRTNCRFFIVILQT